MKELLTSIYTKVTATTGVAPAPVVHNSFYNSINGRFYFNHGPQQPTLPFCVYYLITENHEYNFTDTFESVIVQFSIFSSASSSGEINDIYGYLKTLFDWCTLSVSGYTHLKMERDFAKLAWLDDVSIWEYMVQYRILLQD